MKENRRLYRIFSIILCITSVFLLFSCGIPTYCTLSNTSVTKGTSGSDITFSIYSQILNDNESLIKNGPGLILLYTWSNESLYNSDIYSESVQSAISTAYLNKISYNFPNNYNNFVFDYSDVSSNKFEFYKFKKNDTQVVAPTYNYNFNIKSGKINNAKFVMKKNSEKSIYLYDKDNVSNVLNFETDSRSDYNYLNIFASITTGSGDFSNLYYSDLYYIGSFIYEIKE